MTACIGDNTVVEFIEGTLSAARVTAVEKHIARCEPCRLRVVTMGTSPSMVENAPTPPAGVGAHLQLQPGMRVGRFTVGREIGRGGIGVVFAAYDPQLERNVALKFLQSASQSSERAIRANKGMLAEGRAMARLAHPGIVTVHEVGTFQDEPFIVMELLHGATLNDWLGRWNTRPFTAIVEVFRQAGQALAHAHAHGLAHGDFKPDNVLVDDSDRVKVMDFGLSRLLDGDRAGQRSGKAGSDAMFMGTPRYMAPEQFEGQPSDPRSDQFSFCVALYEALHGEHPFAYDTPLSLIKLAPELAVRAAPPRPDVPAWLLRALQKGLHRDPAQRHGSMDELLAALAPPAPMRARPGRGLVAALSALLVVCFFGYALGAWHGASRATLADIGAPSGSPTAAVHGPESRRREPEHRDQAPEHTAEVLDAGAGATDASASQGPSHDARHQQYATWDSRGVEMAIVRYVHSFVDGELRRVDRTLQRFRGEGATGQEPGNANGANSATLLDRLVADVDELRMRQDMNDMRIAALEGDLERDRRAEPAAEQSIRPTGALRRGEGLSREQVRAGIQQRWRDLEVCFREWRERQPRGHHVLAVEARIGTAGRARVTKLRGLSDKVVKQCVSGAIEAARFRRWHSPSSIEMGLHSHDDSLRMVHLRSHGAVIRR